MKKIKIIAAVTGLVIVVGLVGASINEIKNERKIQKNVVKNETVVQDGTVTYELSDASREQVRELVKETVASCDVSLTNDQIEELTDRITKDVQSTVEDQYEKDINDAIAEHLDGKNIDEEDLEDLKNDIEGIIKRETSKTPSVLYGELKENLNLEGTISDYLAEEGYLSTDNIDRYVSSKNFKDNVDARIAKAMKDNKMATTTDVGDLADSVAGDLKKSVDNLKSDITTTNTNLTNLTNKTSRDKQELEGSISSVQSDVSLLSSQKLEQSTFNNFYSQFETDWSDLQDWKNQKDLDISDLQNADIVMNSRVAANESSISSNETAISSLEESVGNINVYVGDDGQLHYVDGAGADTALNFSSGELKRYKIGSWSYHWSNSASDFPSYVRTFDAKSVPNYQDLTADNFSYNYTSITVDGNDHTTTTTYYPRISYNPTTGIVSITGLSGRASEGWSGVCGSSGDVYCWVCE